MLPLNLLLATALAAVPGAAEPRAVTAAVSRIVFVDTFRTLDVGPGRTWGWQTAAYSRCTDSSDNPAAWKLDRLTTDALSTASGHLVITATPRPDGAWNTGLLTTGDSCDSGGNGAQVRTGDFLLAHIRLPEANTGTWPGLWTWRDGKNEVDVFEWHADRPENIEFVNHVRSGDTVFTAPYVGAGKWIYIGARFGADNTTWYIGTDSTQLTPAFSDRTGVGPDFAAYPILNLSVSDGAFHRPPAGTTPATLESDLFMIQRPAPASLPDGP
ncbi:beta-glucanase [Kitasatospora sp. NBC_01539]|uniref:beta-glucanase n=1 Tax=Kitasatospora sp. NBC_01539 TaxID=2903577 RepID=UPI0038600FC9